MYSFSEEKEAAGHSVPRGPLVSPGFWLHHAALAWRQVFDRRLCPLALTPTQFMLLASAGWLTATSGRPPAQQGIRIAVDLDEEMFGPGGTSCARPSSTSRPEPGPLPDPQGGRPVRADPSPCRACPQRDSNPCRRLERAVS